MSRDPYEVLGVKRGASADEIKKAYRKKAHATHPDKQGGSDSAFKEVNEAYNEIKDGGGSSYSGPRVDKNGNPFGGGTYSTWSEGGELNYEDLRKWSEMAERMRKQKEAARKQQSAWEDIFGGTGYNPWEEYNKPLTAAEVQTQWLTKLRREQERHEQKLKEINDWFNENLRKASR